MSCLIKKKNKMMEFLEYCDQYKAFNKMPNKEYFYNSKNIGGAVVQIADGVAAIKDFQRLMREIDERRAHDMPQQKQRQQKPPLPPLPRRTFFPVSDNNETDVYASFRGCARQQHSYAFSHLKHKKTRLNGGNGGRK